MKTPRPPRSLSIDIENDVVNKSIVEKIESFELPKTGFNFIDEHFGFKRKQMHLICSTSGAGKSTLVRSIIMNLIERDAKVLIISTEETLEDYKYKLIKGKCMADFVTRNLRFIEERNIFETEKYEEILLPEFFNGLDEVLGAIPEIDIVVYDNITTSPWYTDINIAMPFVNGIYRAMKTVNASLICVAHTSSNIRQSEIEITPECVRGSKTIGLRAEYFYFLRSLETLTGNRRNIIEVKKARAFGEMSRFELNYSQMTQKYLSDQKLEAGEFFEALNEHRRRSTVKKT